VCQPSICTGARLLLLTRIAATEKRFIVRADEKLTAFLELEAVIRQRWQHASPCVARILWDRDDNR
jgi:hypothetical protein